MARRILEAIYEPEFLETSYGFRPGRSCHDALRRFNAEVMRQPVNWIVDLDLAQFFHIPTDLVVAQEASDVESSSRLDFLLLHNFRRRFVA
jgi:hypothetical protein